MLINSLLLVIGLLLLYYGSEWLVSGSSSVAILYSIRPIVIGLTIVAFGTSAPEFLVSLFASSSGESGISIGNILGSNVINIALVLGASILVKPITIRKGVVYRELLFMVLVSIGFWAMCLDGVIDFFNGIILVCLLILFLIYGFFTAKKDDFEDNGFEISGNKAIAKNVLMILAGISFLCIGAHWVVENAVAIAESFHVSKTFIGLSIVAFGTSIPELATSVVAAKKEESSIAIGNVVGSNVFNICMVMGIVGLINPIHVEKSLNHFEFPFMVMVSIALLVFFKWQRRLERRHGLFLIASFILYIAGSYYLL